MAEYTIKDTQAFYDEMGSFYHRFWGPYLHWGLFANDDELEQAAKNTTRYFLSKLPIKAEDFVCDLACGAGGPLSLLRREIGCACVAVDLSSTQLRLAQGYLGTPTENLPAAFSFIQADAHMLPFSAASFDALCCFSSFYYFHNKAQVLEEISRVLKPNGCFFFDDMVETAPLSQEEIREIFERQRLSNLGIPKGYRELLSEHGFHLLCEEDLTSHFIRSYEILKNRLQGERHRYPDISETRYRQLLSGFERLILAATDGRLGWWAFWCRKG